MERAHSLIAPVEPYSDVTLDLTSLVLGEVSLDQLPTQVDELIHHMTQLMEEIHLVFLLRQPKKDFGYVIPSYCRIYYMLIIIIIIIHDYYLTLTLTLQFTWDHLFYKL